MLDRLITLNMLDYLFMLDLLDGLDGTQTVRRSHKKNVLDDLKGQPAR